MTLEVGPLPPGQSKAAAALLARAFIDYPGFLAIGPRHRAGRAALIRRHFLAEMTVARRYGGEVLAASRDGRPLGVALVFAPGRHERPPWTVVLHAPFVLFGPGAVVRGLRVQTAMDAAQLDEPHVWLNALGVAPEAQLGGAGSALVGELVARSERHGVPAFLHTTRPENPAYYRRFGFEVVGERPLPRGHRFWSMLRPVESG